MALVLLGSALLFVALFVDGWSQLRAGGYLARFDTLAEFANSVTGSGSTSNSVGHQLLRQSGYQAGQGADVTALLQLQSWLGNQVCCVGPSGIGTSADHWQSVLQGQGLSCGAMSQLFLEMVSALGLPARLVQLYRSDFVPLDTHVVVEVWVKGSGWVVFDPTFNVTFQTRDGALLGVEAVQARLSDGRAESIVPTYHGGRRYPANIQTYYLDWRTLFGNAYVFSACVDCMLWERLPPFRYWLGPVHYAFGSDLGAFARAYNRLYFMTVVVFPMLASGFFAATLAILIWGRKKDSCAA